MGQRWDKNSGRFVEEGQEQEQDAWLAEMDANIAEGTFTAPKVAAGGEDKEFEAWDADEERKKCLKLMSPKENILQVHFAVCVDGEERQIFK